MCVEVEVGRSAEGEGEAGGHFVRWNAARRGVGQTVQTEEDGSGRGAAAAGTEVREWPPSLRRLHVELPFMIHAIRPAAATIASKPMLDSMIIPHINRLLFLVIVLAQISALLAVRKPSRCACHDNKKSYPRAYPASRRTVSSLTEHRLRARRANIYETSSRCLASVYDDAASRILERRPLCHVNGPKRRPPAVSRVGTNLAPGTKPVDWPVTAGTSISSETRDKWPGVSLFCKRYRRLREDQDMQGTQHR